jgi:glycerophosphoryl diester phosphodiesterase
MNPFSLQVILLFSIIIISCSRVEPPEPLIIAHRGASGYATENTLSAFEIAYEQHSSAIELDIWRTIDDSIVVFHDRDSIRLTGKTLIVPESTYAELRELSLPGNEYIPTLREVLETVPADTEIFIEIKNCWELGEAGEVFPMVKDILEETNTINQAAFISFNIETLVEAKNILPDVPCYWITEKEAPSEELVNLIKKNILDGIDIEYHLATKELADAFIKNGLGFFVWTVNDPQVADIMFHQYNVTGVTTDYPDKILKIEKENE